MVPFCEIRGGFPQAVGCRINRVNPVLPQKLGELRLVADGCVALEASVKCLVGTAYCFSFMAVMPHRPQHRKKLASLEIPEELVQCSPRPSPRPAYSLRRVQEEELEMG